MQYAYLCFFVCARSLSIKQSIPQLIKSEWTLNGSRAVWLRPRRKELRATSSVFKNGRSGGVYQYWAPPPLSAFFRCGRRGNREGVVPCVGSIVVNKTLTLPSLEKTSGNKSNTLVDNCQDYLWPPTRWLMKKKQPVATSSFSWLTFRCRPN